MYKHHKAIIRHIGDDGNNITYTDMLDAKGISWELIEKRNIIELSPGHVKFVEIPENVVVEKAGDLRIGKYLKDGKEIYFIEMGIEFGKNVINHTTIIYDEKPDESYMKAISLNYLNLLQTEAREDVY